jgi:hypothetical protein
MLCFPQVIEAFPSASGANKKLHDLIKEKISGNLSLLLQAVALGRAAFDATSLFEAMDGVGTTESVLIDILTSRSNAEITQIKLKFQELFGKNLEATIMKETRGHLEKVLVALLQANREEGAAIDAARVRADAEALHRAGEKKIGTDEDKFIEILAKRSILHNRAVCAEYAKISTKGLIGAIKSECSGDFRDALIALADSYHYLAEEIHDAVAGIGTKDKKLIRLLVGSSKARLDGAKTLYLTEHKKSIMTAVEGDTSGDYRAALRRVLCVSTHDFAGVSLREAMKGVGTDTNALVRTLTSVPSTKAELAEIAKAYERSFGTKLDHAIKSETSGDLSRFLVALVTPKETLMATLLHDAISGLGTRESVLLHVLGARSNKEIVAIQNEFSRLYGGKALLNEIKGDITGKAETLFTALMRGNRNEAVDLPQPQAALEAQAIFNAGEGQLGTNENSLIEKITHFSSSQLRQINEEYRKICGKNIADSIKSETSGLLETALLACLDNDGYVATLLKKALQGFGTDDAMLIGIVASRDKAENKRIAETYQARFGKSLLDDVKGDTSGAYQRAVIGWLGF